MPTYTIDTNEKLKVDLTATGTAAKIQTAKFLLATELGSVPLARDIGWTPAVDEPIDQAIALNAANITSLLQDNIEGLIVEDIETTADTITGKLTHKVVITIDESI